MSYSEIAKMVASVVADRDTVPVLTQLHLYGDRIQGSNGRMVLDAPWDWEHDTDLNLPAGPFCKALDRMDNPTMAMTDGKLVVKQGRMKATIPVSRDAYPRSPATEEPFSPVDWASLGAAWGKVLPFVSSDASKPWATGILYRGGWVYATNNVVLIRAKCNLGPEEFDVPAAAAAQLLSLGTVTGRHITKNAITFTLASGAWFRTARMDGAWPGVDGMLEQYDYGALPKLPDMLAEDVEQVLPFVPDPKHPVIRFVDGKVATLEGDMNAEVVNEGVAPGTTSYHAVPLGLVLRLASHMDFSAYPKPTPFANADGTVQGVIAGVRV